MKKIKSKKSKIKSIGFNMKMKKNTANHHLDAHFVIN